MSAVPDQLQPTSQAPTMTTPKRWPLVATLGYRGVNIGQDAQLINAYAEKDRDTGLWNVEKRPGFQLTPEVVGTGKGQGIITVTVPYAGNPGWIGLGQLTVYINNNTLYYITTDVYGNVSAPVSLGTVGLGHNVAKFLAVPNSTTIMFSFADGVAGYYAIASDLAYYVYLSSYDPIFGYPIFSLGTMQGGDSSGWPRGTVPGIVELDGYAYVMDYTGAIWESTNQNVFHGVGSWSGNQITAANDADQGVILTKQLIYIVAVKSWSTQFFYDAGNPVGSSLSPVSGAIFNFGCLSPDAYAELDGVLFWATQSKEGTYSIVEVENLQFKFISTPSVERLLDLATGGSFYAFAYQHVGHKFYVLTNVTNNVTMVYDIGEKLWYRWTDYQGNCYPVAARAVDPDGNEWHQMRVSGSTYEMKGDYQYPNDYGNLVPVDIYTPNFDDGVGRQKTLWQMRFNADQIPGSKLLVRASDDDYQTWSNFRQVDLSKKPDNCILNDEGTFYRRAYHFRHYANTAFRIRSVDLQMDRGVM